MRPTTVPTARTTTHEFDTQIPRPAVDVWRWHTRPGAVVRLTPGFCRMRVRSETDSLRCGTTVFDLPGGLTWVARHDPDRYVDGRRFVDDCVNNPFRLTGWHHEHLIADGGDGTSTVTDRITSRLPIALISRFAAYRRRQLTDDLTHLAEFRALGDLDSPQLTIAVSGASGLVGTRLVALLRTAGHTVIPLVRRPSAVGSEGARLWDPAAPDPRLLDGVDAVVHLAGAPIFGRFTGAHKAAVRDSRVGPTRRLAGVAASCGVKTFVCASAVGFYGAARPEPVGEDAARGGGFLADVVADWEDDCTVAAEAGVRVVNIRTGLVLSGGSPLLTLLGASSRAGGGRLGSGEQHFPWIGVDDLVDIYHRAVVDAALVGPVNAVAPDDITQAEFASALAEAQKMRVPLRMPVPTVGPAVLLGRTGAAELALADQHARPVVLSALGHPFRFGAVRDLLVHELG
ncbi:TIGR01777 family oxidoreductase [uncultured Corynebacterium sp.]|uniref:TIGR01777 family oxidoreductase n=1 Tax=uncultured Corynebacterium sp. TaxID=159447 RepID=UPI0025FB3C83|nr:TIGR01777 family oxidoreductase [uncultured Corynebacterium sp.]